jgi:hypothetical protein
MTLHVKCLIPLVERHCHKPGYIILDAASNMIVLNWRMYSQACAAMLDRVKKGCGT